MSAYEIVLKAIMELDEKNKFICDQMVLKITKIYSPYWRQLDLDWWEGKAISLLAEDADGNYIVLHSSGSISYLNLKEMKATEISKSVKDFVLSLH